MENQNRIDAFGKVNYSRREVEAFAAAIGVIPSMVSIDEEGMLSLIPSVKRSEEEHDAQAK